MAGLIIKWVNEELTFRRNVSLDREEYYYRYLDLPKLIDLVQSKSIAFPSLSTMEDKNEGSSFKRIVLEHNLKMPNLKGEKRKKQQEHLKEEQEIELQKKDIFCSCWHQNSYESMLHWKTYGEKGFVIRILDSDLQQFLQTLEDKDIQFDTENYSYPEIYYGRVKYELFNSLEDLTPFINPSFVKEQSFSFEQEFRILVQFRNKIQEKTIESPAPVKINFSGNEFFKFDIFAHPEMPNWEINTLNQLSVFKDFPIQESRVFKKGSNT